LRSGIFSRSYDRRLELDVADILEQIEQRKRAQYARFPSRWSGRSSTLAGLEALLSPAFHAGFLFRAIDAALLQNFVLRRHDFL
jgi:hypothetical protein